MDQYFKITTFDLPLELLKEESSDIVLSVISDFGITFLPGLEPFGKGSLLTKLFDSYNTFSFNKSTLSLLFKNSCKFLRNHFILKKYTIFNCIQLTSIL
jgi:hypothetical protein